MQNALPLHLERVGHTSPRLRLIRGEVRNTVKAFSQHGSATNPKAKNLKSSE